MSKKPEKTPIETPPTPTPRPNAGAMGRGNPMGMMGVVQKPKNFKKTMRQLGSYLKPFWLPLTFVVIFAISSTIFAIASPKILGQMTTQVVNDFVHRTA